MSALKAPKTPSNTDISSRREERSLCSALNACHVVACTTEPLDAGLPNLATNTERSGSPLKYLNIRFSDQGSETIPVDDDYELPELDEFDHRELPPYFRVEAADGSQVAFPLARAEMFHLTDAKS